MANPKIQKYIINKCKKLYNEEKKRYPGIIPNVPDIFCTDRNHLSVLKYTEAKIYKIGGFKIVPAGDTDHIESMIVIFGYKNKDTTVVRKIPAPTNKELNDLGFRKEEKE